VQTSPDGERSFHQTSAQTIFTSPPTITFTEGPAQVDPSRFLAELKTLGVDVAGITEADIWALQRSTPRVMEWLSGPGANLAGFAADPAGALQAILPRPPLGARPPTDVAASPLRVKSMIEDAGVQRLTLDVLTWAERSAKNLRLLAENPAAAVAAVAVAVDQPRPVVEATVDALIALAEQTRPVAAMSAQTVLSAQRATRKES